MGRSVPSLGIALFVAAAGLFAATQAGCGADDPESAAVPADTTSTHLAAPHVRQPAHPRPYAGPAATTSRHVAAPHVRQPAHPRPYAVPAGAVLVSSATDLAAALANGTREVIVLAPGVYDNPQPFVDRDGDRLYAARLGRAGLKEG